MIKIVNLNKEYRITEPLLKKIIDDVLKNIKKSGDADLEFVFLDDKSIRRLNKKYKNSDRATDVLSFRLDREEFGNKKFLGDIFISINTVFENSRRFGTDPAKELVLYVIHGILHLYGYDDLAPKDSLRMRKKETQVLRSLCRDLSKVLMPR